MCTHQFCALHIFKFYIFLVKLDRPWKYRLCLWERSNKKFPSSTDDGKTRRECKERKRRRRVEQPNEGEFCLLIKYCKDSYSSSLEKEHKFKIK